MKRTLLLLVLNLAWAGPVFAHAHLVSAVPAADATVTAPTGLTLTFSESIEIALSGAEITDPQQNKVATAAPTLSGDGKVLLIGLPAGLLPAGAYTVRWHVLATDGHKTDGSFTFTVKPQ